MMPFENMMRLEKLYWNRKLFYPVLVLLGGMMLIDATPQYTLLHGHLKQWVDPVLDVTGLWQGSWELFAPTPDHVNVRVFARLTWTNGKQTVWQQPNWHEMSGWEKGRNFRRMSYYDNLWRASNRSAWRPFCEKLAEEESDGEFERVREVLLAQDRDVLPTPEKQWRKAYSPSQYSRRGLIYRWVADE